MYESNYQQTGRNSQWPWLQPPVEKIPTLHLGYQATPWDRTDYADQLDLVSLYQSTKDSIVRITTTRQDANGTISGGRGSGFFVSKDGTLATAYHVVKDNRDLLVETADGGKYRAVITDCDPATDLATVKVLCSPYEIFQPLPLSTRQSLNSGERLVSLGHPQGWDNTFLSVGTLQKARTLREFTVNGGLMAGENPNRTLLESVIHVEQGNSGGPMLDSSGQVVGIIDMTENGQSRVPTIAEANPVGDLLSLLNRSRQLPQPSSLATRWQWQPVINPAMLPPFPVFNWLL